MHNIEHNKTDLLKMHSQNEHHVNTPNT